MSFFISTCDVLLRQLTLIDVCEDTTYSSFFNPILIQNHFIWMPWLKPPQTQMFLFCEWGVSLGSEQLWRTSAVWCFIRWRRAVVCSSLGTRINCYLQLPRFIDVPDIINNTQLERAYLSALHFGLLIFFQKMFQTCFLKCFTFVYICEWIKK